MVDQYQRDGVFCPTFIFLHDILKHCKALAQVKTERDISYKNFCVLVALRVVKQNKIYNLRKLGNIMKI